MPQFTVEQRSRIIQLFNEAGCLAASRQATVEFGRLVTRLQVRRLVIKLNTRYCLHNLNSKMNNHGSHSGRRRSARSLENCIQVLNLTCDSGLSLRSVASKSGLSKSSVQIIVHKDLLLKPYRLQVVPKLSNRDRENRVSCSYAIQSLFSDPNFQLSNMYF